MSSTKCSSQITHQFDSNPRLQMMAQCHLRRSTNHLGIFYNNWQPINGPLRQSFLLEPNNCSRTFGQLAGHRATCGGLTNERLKRRQAKVGKLLVIQKQQLKQQQSENLADFSLMGHKQKQTQRTIESIMIPVQLKGYQHHSRFHHPNQMRPRCIKLATKVSPPASEGAKNHWLKLVLPLLLLILATSVTRSTCHRVGHEEETRTRISIGSLHNRSSSLRVPLADRKMQFDVGTGNRNSASSKSQSLSGSGKRVNSSASNLVAMQRFASGSKSDKVAVLSANSDAVLAAQMSGFVPISQYPITSDQYKVSNNGKAQVKRAIETHDRNLDSSRGDRISNIVSMANGHQHSSASDESSSRSSGAKLVSGFMVGQANGIAFDDDNNNNNNNNNSINNVATATKISQVDQKLTTSRVEDELFDIDDAEEDKEMEIQADLLGTDTELELAIVADKNGEQPSISANYNNNDNYSIHLQQEQRERLHGDQVVTNSDLLDERIAAIPDKIDPDSSFDGNNNQFEKLIVRQLTDLIMNKPLDQMAISNKLARHHQPSSTSRIFQDKSKLKSNLFDDIKEKDFLNQLENLDLDANIKTRDTNERFDADNGNNFVDKMALIEHSSTSSRTNLANKHQVSNRRPPSDGKHRLSLKSPLSSEISTTISPNHLQENHNSEKQILSNNFEDEQMNHLVVTTTPVDENYGESQQATTESNLVANWQEDQTVTCYPDYEDQSILEAAGGGNLTHEQQQQLLIGVDSSGLLPVQGNGSSEASLEQQQQQQQQQQQPQLQHQQHKQGSSLAGQCVLSGSRMIAIITKVITPILFGIIVVVGLLGNIIVMLVILEDRKTERELTPTNLLILDLSLADLSFIIFCIPFTGWDYAVGHWIFGSLWCKINQYLIIVCAISSIYTLVLMSIDRFMAIVYPIECMSYRTSKNMLYAIYIKWLIILLIALPTWTMHGLVDSPLGPDQYNCRFLVDLYNPLHFQLIFFVTSYLFPLILIFCLYLSLLNKLWFGTKPHGHKESLKMLESKKKVTWLVAGIVVVFALCWCPIQVMLILMRLKTHKITATYVAIQVFAHTLGYMNSCINPIVYAFASETFHQSFKRSWLGRLFACFGSGHNGNKFNGAMSQYRHNSLALGQQTGDRFINPRHSTTQTTSCKLSASNKNVNGQERGRNQSLNNIFSSQNNNDSQQANRSPSLAIEGGSSTLTLVTTTPNHHRLDNDTERSNIINNYIQPRRLQPRDRPTIVDNNNLKNQQRRQQQSIQNLSSSLSCSKSDVAMNYEQAEKTHNNDTNYNNTDQVPKHKLIPSGIRKQRSQTPTCSISGQGGGQMTLIPRQPTATDSIFSSRTLNNDLISQNSINNNHHTILPLKQQLVAQVVDKSNGNQVSHRCEPDCGDSSISK